MSHEDRVRDLLGQAFEVDPPAGAGPDVASVRASHRRRNALAAGSAAAATVLVVLAVLVLPDLARSSARRPAVQADATTGTASTAPAPDGTTPPATPSVTAPPSVAATPISLPARPLKDGDLVGATGGVLALPGQPVRWCPDGFPDNGAFVVDSNGEVPPPERCDVGVDVTGVDLGKLSLRLASGGAVWGYAYLRGTWQHGSVAVTLQTEQRQQANDTSPSWTTPPCPASAVGSLKVGPATNPDEVENQIQHWGEKHQGEIVTTVQYRPTPTRAVMVVAAVHPDVVRAGLHLKASELCVVQSRYTTAQLTAARAPFEAAMRTKHAGTLLVTRLSQTVDNEAQSRIRVEVAWWTPALAAVPVSDAVTVTAWLSPLAANAPLPPLVPTGPAAGTGPTTTVPTSTG